MIPFSVRPIHLPVEVSVPAGTYDRDSVKENIPLLTIAINALGLRVGVNLCTMHVKALYDYMQVPCPGSWDCIVETNVKGSAISTYMWILDK